MKQPSVAVLGAGRLGRGVALLLSPGSSDVRVWARRELQLKQVGTDVPSARLCETIEEACEDVDVVVIAVPATAVREVAAGYGPHARGDHLVLHACRGVDEGFMLPHQAIRSQTCAKKIGALGGPLYLQDLQDGRPLFAVLGSRFDETVVAVRRLCEGTQVKVHGSRDILGVEVSGAISNVAQIAAGMADALDLGDTARGVLLTHGLSEAERLGVALGADLNTFAGLAGVGDLIPRRVSSTQRNAQVGHLVASGKSLEEALDECAGCVEGVVTAREAVNTARNLGFDLPLVEAVNDVLVNERDAREAMESILALDLYLGREALAS
jgi:glycerol-3-phosphate dehydrogenase (NAD(P)+)